MCTYLHGYTEHPWKNSVHGSLGIFRFFCSIDLIHQSKRMIREIANETYNFVKIILSSVFYARPLSFFEKTPLQLLHWFKSLILNRKLQRASWIFFKSLEAVYMYFKNFKINRQIGAYCQDPNSLPFFEKIFFLISSCPFMLSATNPVILVLQE